MRALGEQQSSHPLLQVKRLKLNLRRLSGKSPHSHLVLHSVSNNHSPDHRSRSLISRSTIKTNNHHRDKASLTHAGRRHMVVVLETLLTNAQKEKTRFSASAIQSAERDTQELDHFAIKIALKDIQTSLHSARSQRVTAEELVHWSRRQTPRSGDSCTTRSAKKASMPLAAACVTLNAQRACGT